ncbi:MAG: FlgD immunoglobulin-like domain containing protein, partial [Bacteroidota bacterium]
VWQDILDLNAGLKDSAQFRENISFDASSSFSRSTTQSQTQSRTIDMEVAIESSLAHSFGVAVNNAGIGGGTTATMRMAFGESRTTSQSRDITTGFTLSDSDNGDNYTVNLKHDPVYGTPVFEMISGATSCPWEGGLKRQGVQLSVDRNAAIDVPSDQAAVFDLTLGNTSETNEASVYHVTLLQESNPDGAIVSLNGVTLTGNNDVAFFIQPGQQINATLTVEKGPQAFDYSDLRIMMFSPCERENADGAIPDAPFSDIEELDVSFIELCSPLTMTSPQEDWVIAASQNDLLPITLTDYDLARADLQSIRLQFRPKIPNAPFVNAVTLPKANLNPGFHTFNWDVSQLDDGPYELRAISSCGGSVPDRITPLISGIIDRTAPQLFGTEEPVDGVLGLNDEISITFDEDIICANLISLAAPVSLTQGAVNHINLTNTETGLPIEKVVSCQGNKITIVPDIQNRFIEGQVLRVDVLGVEDQYGNVMTTTQTWEFLIVRNPLEWLGGDVDLVVAEGNSTTFQKQIINTGAFDVHYSLSGPLTAGTLLPTLLPPWLTASPMSGIIPPGATETVTFTSSEQLDGGTYEAGIFAANSYGAPQLRFDLRVLCPEPNWVIQPDQFDHSMIITAELIVDQDTSKDLYDRIGAFVNGELRGTGELRYVPQLERYQAYLTVFSNQTQGETVEFQIWDASDCRLYENVLESFPFQMNAVQGTPVAPVYLHTSSDLSRTISLNQGWTWFSLNLEGQDSTINQMLNGIPSQSGDILRNQLAFSQYTPDFGWVGPLNEIDRRFAYQFKQTTSQDLVVRGRPVDIETVFIPIVRGWNWISYLPQNGAELDDALPNLVSTTGDIIKNQTTFAQYIENIGWIGSLNFMQPNDGYLLYSDRADTLIYPARLNRRSGRNLEEEAPQAPLDWAVKPEQFLQSMTFTAQIEGGADENAWLAAYSGDEIRGLVQFSYIPEMDQTLAFLTVYGLTEEEVIHFEYYHPKLQEVVPIINTFGFQENAQYGDPINPVILDLALTTTIDPVAAGYDLEVFPNPFKEQIAINYVLPNPERIRIDLTNLLGQPVRLLADKKQAAGSYELSWDGTNDSGVRVAAGVYILRLRTDQFEKSIQIILKP